MKLRYDVVVVGAGHGGAQAAIALRQYGFTGTIALIGEEPDPPYERPPLSKEYLVGERDFQRILIRPAEFWAEREIALMLRCRVDSLDPIGRHVTLADGAIIGYGHLVWATGGVPRRLTCDGHDLRGVHTVRTRIDIDMMLAELSAIGRVVVIGGGYIGLEAAAGMAKLGKHVTVLEAMDRVLARVAGEPLSRFYEAEHRAHGVDVRLGARVDCIVGADNHVTGVKLDDGSVVPAEMVIVGIGIVPAVGALLEAGAEGGNGVAVDAYCRTSLPDVYAVGDCALHRNAFANDDPVRLESVQNATEQGVTAARAICGHLQPYRAVPWFWSNQYDLKLQTVGLSARHDEIVVRGRMADRSFSIVYFRGGRVIALDCVNAMRDYVQGKHMVAAGMSFDRALLADAAIPLKSLVAEATRLAEPAV